MSTPKKAKDTVVQPKQNHSVIESQNHRMAWVEKDLKDHPVATPLPRAGSPSPRPGCPEPHAAWKPMFKLQCTYKKHYRSHSCSDGSKGIPACPTALHSAEQRWISIQNAIRSKVETHLCCLSNECTQFYASPFVRRLLSHSSHQLPLLASLMLPQ